jgi:hypothetical protein
MAKDKSYGEIAFNTWKRYRNDSVSAVWDNQSDYTQDTWENIAACTLAAYHQRQITLSHQTRPSWLAQAQLIFQQAKTRADELNEPLGIVGEAFEEYIRKVSPQPHGDPAARTEQ